MSRLTLVRTVRLLVAALALISFSQTAFAGVSGNQNSEYSYRENKVKFRYKYTALKWNQGSLPAGDHTLNAIQFGVTGSSLNGTSLLLCDVWVNSTGVPNSGILVGTRCFNADENVPGLQILRGITNMTTLNTDSAPVYVVVQVWDYRGITASVQEVGTSAIGDDYYGPALYFGDHTETTYPCRLYYDSSSAPADSETNHIYTLCTGDSTNGCSAECFSKSNAVDTERRKLGFPEFTPASFRPTALDCVITFPGRTALPELRSSQPVEQKYPNAVTVSFESKPAGSGSVVLPKGTGTKSPIAAPTS